MEKQMEFKFTKKIDSKYRNKAMQEISEESLKSLLHILHKYGADDISEVDLKRIVFLSTWIDENSIQKDEGESNERD